MFVKFIISVFVIISGVGATQVSASEKLTALEFATAVSELWVGRKNCDYNIIAGSIENYVKVNFQIDFENFKKLVNEQLPKARIKWTNGHNIVYTKDVCNPVVKWGYQNSFIVAKPNIEISKAIASQFIANHELCNFKITTYGQSFINDSLASDEKVGIRKLANKHKYMSKIIGQEYCKSYTNELRRTLRDADLIE